MEDFQALLERVLVTITDSGALRDKSLNLLAKEKLSEYDIQVYKFWLMDHSREDCFESFVDWIELKVEVMEEAQEEADVGQKSEKADHRQQVKQRSRGFNTRNTSRGCVVSSCKEDHPPWVCGTFRSLPVQKRKELITKAGRCYRCLAAGHIGKNCTRPRRCGVEGCPSDRHSRYLHESAPTGPDDSKQQLRPDPPEFIPRQASHLQERAHQTDQTNTPNDPSNSHGNQQSTHRTSQADNVSLMVLPAIISNGQRKLKVNVMLDSCSTSSYITEAAASELELQGKPISLTIVGTGGTEVQKQSSCVNLTVGNLEGTFEASLQAHVLDDIASDTPAIQWAKLKDKWPHLKDIPFANIARRGAIDVMIGSDHPLYHLVLQEVSGKNQTDPIGRLTNLGCVCFGPTLVEDFRRNSHFSRTYRSAVMEQCQTPDDALRKFWELDAIGIKEEATNALTPDEKNAVKKASETIKIDDQRYEIGIPWKDNEPSFTDNYEVALARLESLEYWTDSENVWYWVRNQSRAFKPFVSNRIGEIQRKTNPDQWRHVPGVLNPADLATRGLTIDQLASSTLWTEGPEFLNDEAQWPKPKNSLDIHEPSNCEKRAAARTHVSLDNESEDIVLNRFSDYFEDIVLKRHSQNPKT